MARQAFYLCFANESFRSGEFGLLVDQFDRKVGPRVGRPFAAAVFRQPCRDILRDPCI
jgi:hypothetical protein